MLTHIVVWKYRTDVEQFAREEHVNLLRNLASIIPEVQSLAVGFDMLFLPRSYDTGLVATFADRAALAAIVGARQPARLWTAANASIELWPHQLEPALAVIGGATGALVGATEASRPGYYLAQGNCYYRYPSGEYVAVDPRSCD